MWGPAQEAALSAIKDSICSAECMAKYDPTLPTVLSADASSFGLGSVLSQVQKNGDRRPIAFASRSLTSAETRYAQIEKEALALTWAAERFDEYLRGLDAVFENDHKPLVPLLGTYSIDVLPPRVQRFRMRLMRYRFKMVYVPGKQLITADGLSRAPLKDKRVVLDELTVGEIDAYSQGCLTGLETGQDFVSKVK